MKVKIRLVRSRIEETFVEIEVPDPPPEAETIGDWERNQQYMENLLRTAEKKGKKEGSWKEIKITKPRVRPPKWEENRDQNEECVCSHAYHRHFDSYGEMYPCGCKYCECRYFRTKENKE